MASNSGGGFSKEQLALAKQLQSGYVTSGTFHSQGQGGSNGSSSPAARMPHTTHPVRSQPPHLRSANGLVRPLPGNATRPVLLATTGRPAPPVQPSAARPAPTPTYTTVPPHLRASVPAARPVTQTAQSATQSASTGPAPPVHMPENSLPYTRPPPMPTNLQPAMTPTPMFSSVPATTAATPVALDTANTAFSTASIPPTIQQSPNAQLLEPVSAFQHQPGSQSQVQAEAQTEGREDSTPEFVGLSGDAVAKAIMQGIKINQSGKPIVWNWTSEEPVARELTAVEIEQMKKVERLPPMVYDRPFHENATMKAPGLENKPETTEAPRKLIGLKGSRHAC